MGTGDIALPSFRLLLEGDYKVVGLFTQPDKPVGRKQVMTPPAIKTIALEAGVPVWQPGRLRGSEDLDVIDSLSPDLIVVMAYGQILPSRVIDAPNVACINLHASLLPRFRGASCIQGAIDAGDEQTGITVMHVAPALDEGDVILQHTLKLGTTITGGEVHDQLAELAPKALQEAVDALFDNTAEREVQQDHLSCYAPKLLRNDGELDWTMDAIAIERRVRAYEPWPGTSTVFKDAKGRSKRLKIFPHLEVLPEVTGKPGEVIQLDKNGLVIATGNGAVRVHNLQPEGSPRMTIEQFANGAKIKLGDILG